MERTQQTLQAPSLEEALELVKAGVSKRRMVVIAGACSVNYEGRASSSLGEGERLVVLKQDGSALVHRPKDYPPVNWQPPGSLFQTHLGKGGLVIQVYRRKDNESMEIVFTSVMMASAFDLRDSAEFSMHATESDMQKAILLEPGLIEEGFRPMTHEHAVDPGFIDILGRDRDGVLTVVELKRKKAAKAAVLQLKKYMDVLDFDRGRKVRAILVSPEIGAGVSEMLGKLGYEYLALTPQRCAEVLKRHSRKGISDFFDKP